METVKAIASHVGAWWKVYGATVFAVVMIVQAQHPFLPNDWWQTAVAIGISLGWISSGHQAKSDNTPSI